MMTSRSQEGVCLLCAVNGCNRNSNAKFLTWGELPVELTSKAPVQFGKKCAQCVYGM